MQSGDGSPNYSGAIFEVDRLLVGGIGTGLYVVGTRTEVLCYVMLCYLLENSPNLEQFGKAIDFRQI